jgi:glycosyltransferase involved in cell wall biosynthesis
LFFSRFVLSENKGGGCRRELQIAEALSSFHPEFVSAREHISLRTRIWKKIGSSGKNHKMWAAHYKNYAYTLRTFSKKWVRAIGKDIELVVLDEPVYFPELVEKTKEYGIPLVAACQNIESLSLFQVRPEEQHRLLMREIDLLSRADLIITTSREETFLLNNLRLPVFYFPYYPVDPIERRLLKIREERKKSSKRGILLLGSAGNPATLRGMLDVISFCQKNPLPGPDNHMIVAGFATEKLRRLARGEGIDFRGTVTADELDALLLGVKACLCYQKSGAGALTRICEMLIAGVPVLANTHAARSYHGAPGLVEIADLSGIAPGLSQVERWEGEIPGPLRPDSSRLLEAVNRLVKRPSEPQ